MTRGEVSAFFGTADEVEADLVLRGFTETSESKSVLAIKNNMLSL